jgi:hypothetical protein
MRVPFESDNVNGLAVPRLPEDSPVITLEHTLAIEDDLDDEAAMQAERGESAPS